MQTPDPLLIALTGPAGAGKDTVADYLVEHHNYTKLAFADALREEIGRAFDVAVNLLTHRETKEHPMSALALRRCMNPEFIQHVNADLNKPRSPRQIMQWWGTEYRRTQNSHYWVDTFMTRLIREHQQGRYRFVVTDVRRTIEADLLRELRASLWQITRPGHEPKEDAHSSETTGAEFAPDYQLFNGHSITHLRKQAHSTLKQCDQLRQTTDTAAQATKVSEPLPTSTTPSQQPCPHPALASAAENDMATMTPYQQTRRA